MEECGARAGIPEPRLLPLSSEPVPVGARRARVCGPGGWVSRTNRTASVGPRHPEPLALRAPSCERAGPRRARVGSGPAPLSAAGGHPLAARPTRGARRQWPAQPTWPCKGRRPGPPATLLAFPGLYGAPSREGPSTAAASPSLFHSPSPSIVVPQRGGPGRDARLGAHHCRVPAGASRRPVLQTCSCHCPSS